MIDFEHRLICKALMGDHEALAPLRLQIKHLVAMSRTRQTNRYHVEFELPEQYADLKDHSEAYVALYIQDTSCTIEESDSVFNVNLTKIDGYLRWFEISGDFDFRNGFTVKDVFWCKTNLEPNSVEPRTLSSERDYEWGFLYAPRYRG